MIRIREAIIVEGRYDKNTLAQIVDAPILETSGFGIFHDRQRLALLRRLDAGQPLSPQEASRLMASRDQFAAYWRILSRHLKQGKLETDLLP